MQQRRDESLRNFLARFNAAATEIPDLNEHVAMSTLKMGPKPSKLTFSIDKSSPKDYAALLGKAHKYALAEEQAASHRQAEGKSAKKGNKATKVRSSGGDGSTRRLSPKSRAYRGRFDTYTPLTMPRERVLMEIEKENFLEKPQPMRTPPTKRTKNKYCRYHRDHGHNTEDCIQLKDAIEDLIRPGHLDRYIRRQPTSAAAPSTVNPPAEGELP